MKLYFVKSGTADNYVLAVTPRGAFCEHVDYITGLYCGVDLYSYDENGEEIGGEVIAARIAEAFRTNYECHASDYTEEPCYSSFEEWEAEQDSSEYFNRDEAFLIGEYDD